MDFFKAVKTGNLTHVKLCVSEGADINSTDSEGRSALYIGCQYNRANVVDYLLHRGANTEVREKANQWTALIVAADNGYTDIVRVLVDHNVDVNMQNKYGETALWVASLKGHGDIVDILLANNANPNIRKCASRSTALHVACTNNHTEVVRMLLKHTAEIDLLERDGRTGLYKAAYTGDEQTVAVLLQHGAGVNICNTNRATPLYIAAQKGHAAVVDMLLDHGANINSRHVTGATPLIVACFYKHPTVVELLCQRGADIDAINNDGDTALHYTVKENSPNITRVLLKYKPELTRNKEGNTAMDIAKQMQNKYLILLLEDYSKSKGKTCPDVSTAKHAERSSSSVKGDLDVLQSELRNKKNLVQAQGESSEVPKINDYEVILRQMMKRAMVTEEASDGMEEAGAATVATNEADSSFCGESNRVAEKLTNLPSQENDEKDLGNSHMFVIAEKVGDQWKRLGASLGMDLHKIEKIGKDNSTDQVYAAWVMLVQWRDASDISVFEKRRMLLKAVSKIKRLDIQEFI